MTETNFKLEQAALNNLRSPQVIRERCNQIFELAMQDQLHHFRCDLTQLDPVVEYVLNVIQSAYPDWQVPFHSRWRHFQAGGYNRVAQLHQQIAGFSALEQARLEFDLAITSVLLDAGAGSHWRYLEATTQQFWQRSEGLALASYDLFLQGGFSSDPQRPWQADAMGLQHLTPDKLAAGFQVTDQNPLVGLEGRVQLMQQLGRVLAERPDLFGQTTPRPGHLVDYLLQQSQHNSLSAPTILAAILEGLGEIWPGRIILAGVNLGDVWPHSQLPHTGLGSQLVPFHKLSQWLTYSLLEPLQRLGLTITGLDQLTGLAEYRNGGLCLDLGLLHPKHEAVCCQPHLPGSEVIVEWRALTVVLLDRIADRMRQQLGQSATELPLVKILEGGTWAAGRRIAAERRPAGAPPIQVISDGTVF